MFIINKRKETGIVNKEHDFSEIILIYSTEIEELLYFFGLERDRSLERTNDFG